jgi:MFS family permease
LSDTAPLSPGERARLLLYAGFLLLLVSFASPNGGLIQIPVNFFLKNRLRLSAEQVAAFNIWAGAPLYVSFVFGFLRDRWSPFGAGDRGHFALFGLLTGAIYGVIAFMSPTYGLLLAGVILATAVIQPAVGAANALFSGLGQDHAIAGQASTALNMAIQLPLVIGFLLGGQLSDLMEGRDAAVAARILFLVGAGLMAAVAVFGLRGPARLFPARREALVTTPLADVKRLARTWAVYPPVIIMFLWCFAPAGGVVLQYHMANALHASDSQVGAFYAIFWISYFPTFFLYAWLCQRIRLGPLLWLATAVAIPQWVPILFAHTPVQALLLAAPIGLLGGLGNAAYIDLAIRSCPRGLQGTMMMLVLTTTFAVATRFGDYWGTTLYDHQGGFTAAVIATVAVYALIAPVLLFVPRRLTATADGEAFA